MEKKKLPTGIQAFREIREEGCYYVDKTDFAARLIDGAKHNFLSRPRRFGKSLFVDTLHELFKGSEELFRGLYIHDKWDWTVKYPVLRLSFGGADFTEPGQLNTVIMERLAAIERREKLTTEYQTAPGRFADLIERLCERDKNRVVVLVDECDKPVHDMLGTPDLARSNRNILTEFYNVMQEYDDYIRFSFLTGVSRIAPVSEFSGIDDIIDITLDPEYSAICGFTDHDLDTVFGPELEDFDREKIREWYGGHNWLGKETVYAPQSILQLCLGREFRSWWVGDSTPTFLFDALKRRKAPAADPDGTLADESLLSIHDLAVLKLPTLLFQTGYLTIVGEEKVGGRTIYHLAHANRDVRDGLRVLPLEILDTKTGKAPPEKGNYSRW